jgi:hypothetical protein
MNVDRRRFLVHAALGASGAVSLVVLGCQRGNAVIELRDVFADPTDVLAIGRSYLLQHPGEADRAALSARTIDPEDTASSARLRAALRERIRADFAASRLFTADRWILSRTEGRLAALAVLDSDSR